MVEPFRKMGEEFQKVGMDSYDAALRSFGEVNKGFQAIAVEMTDFSRNTFDDVIRSWKQLLGAKSVDQAFEIQAQYAKKAYDNYVAEVSKLGEMYVGLAQSAYKPVEQAVAKGRQPGGPGAEVCI